MANAENLLNWLEFRNKKEQSVFLTNSKTARHGLFINIITTWISITVEIIEKTSSGNMVFPKKKERREWP